MCHYSWCNENDLHVPQHTCVPSGPMISKAPVVLYRKRMIFWKLSSPMLQEPSIKNTSSALAALQTERGKGVERVGVGV